MLHDGILKYAMKRTHYKARQVVKTSGFTKDDFDDIRQDLLRDVLQRLPKFNGDRAGMKTFISRLIDNRIASLIKHRHAACRDSRRNDCSLDDWVHDEDGRWVRRDTTISEDRARAHTGQAPRSRQETLQLAMDTAHVMDSLPDDLRDLCARLRSQTVLEISRETGMSRSSLYERVKQIRARFIEAGLDHYV